MKEVSRKDLRNFGLIAALILLIIGVRIFIKLHQLQPAYFIISLFFVLFSLFLPDSLKPLYSMFIKIAHTIGWINTRIILILSFYLIFVPIGLISRLMQKDFLGQKIERGKNSYWVKRMPVVPDPKRYEKQF